MNNGKIDINTIVGFLLIGGILFYFGYFAREETVPQDKNPSQADTAIVVEETEDLEEHNQVVILSDADSAVGNKDFGTFGNAADPNAEEQLFTIENEYLELQISSKGGQIVKARLKNYRTWDSLPLYLINENARFSLDLRGDRDYETSELNFEGISRGPTELLMRLDVGNGSSLEYHYRLKEKDYMLDWDIISKNFGKYISNESTLEWEQKTFRHEKNAEYERTRTELEYNFAEDDDVDALSAGSDDSEEVNNLNWIAYKQQFFSSILWNKNGSFENAAVASKYLEQEDIIKIFYSKLSVNRTGDDISMPLGLYLGPNKYEILNAYDQNFDELIPLGWGILGWINKGIVLNMFNWLEDYGMNYGLIILIIAVVIKMVLFPLTFTSYKSMAKMRVLKPEIDEINEKFKDKDPMKKQQAVMELYRKAGVNPLGGCIPMLLQFPILIALFYFFPASIELRQESFLWATDLSTYDSIASIPHIPFYGDHISLFTLLMTVSTLIYTYMNQQLTGQNQQFPQMKYFMYLMPIIFLGVFNSYAAALSYYYFLANIITFGQQFAIRAYLDEDKIHAKIQEKKQMPKKENRFMRRMKEIQEQQEGQSRQVRRKK